MGRASEKFDRQLFTLKLAELSRQMQIKSVASDSKARVVSREMGNSLLMHMVGGQLALLRDEWLTGVDRIAREVWQTQGEAMTPDFVREILAPQAMMIIVARESAIKRGLAPPAPLTRVENPYPSQRRLAMEVRKLTEGVANRYEIEACELGYRAREVRGNIVSKGLGRLAERSPQELPGPQLRRVTKGPKIQSTGIIPGQFQGHPHGEWPARSRPAKSTEASANRSTPPNLYFPDLWSRPFTQSDSWKDFHERFTQLANEEERIERAAPKDRLLRGYCDYKRHPEIWAEKGKPKQGPFCLLKAPETGLWMLGDGVNENFQERFRVLAAHAGVALGSPEGTDPEDFWLHRLYLDLMENNSDQLFAASKEGGMILQVSEASATFCSRLERKAVTEAGRLRTSEKQAESPPSQNSGNSAQSTLSGDQRSKRLRATVNSAIAARKMEKHLESRCIGLTDFAATVGTTDRTLRSFRKTGKVRRDIFESIAKQMGTTKEALLRE
jgi:hypothetical protein